MQTITVLKTNNVGIQSNAIIPSDTDLRFLNNGRTFLLALKISEDSKTVQFLPSGNQNQLSFDTSALAVQDTTGINIYGPFPIHQYNDSSGYLNLQINTVGGLYIVAFTY